MIKCRRGSFSRLCGNVGETGVLVSHIQHSVYTIGGEYIREWDRIDTYRNRLSSMCTERGGVCYSIAGGYS